MPDLSRKRERTRLPDREAPYFQRIEEGCYLGYRVRSDTWCARYRDRRGQQHHKAFGQPGLDFDEAARLAREWLGQMGSTAVRAVKRGTVRQALESYVENLQRHDRADTAVDALWRFDAVVYGDPIASMQLETLTREDFLEWRDRVRQSHGKRVKGERAARGRSARTVNRYVNAVAAGLNAALELGHVGHRQAWTLKRIADDIEDDGETALFLSPEQRRLLIACADPHAAELFRAMELTGARPKELARARVQDFDGTGSFGHRGQLGAVRRCPGCSASLQR